MSSRYWRAFCSWLNTLHSPGTRSVPTSTAHSSRHSGAQSCAERCSSQLCTSPSSAMPNALTKSSAPQVGSSFLWQRCHAQSSAMIPMMSWLLSHSWELIEVMQLCVQDAAGASLSSARSSVRSHGTLIELKHVSPRQVLPVGPSSPTKSSISVPRQSTLSTAALQASEQSNAASTASASAGLYTKASVTGRRPHCCATLRSQTRAISSVGTFSPASGSSIPPGCALAGPAPASSSNSASMVPASLRPSPPGDTIKAISDPQFGGTRLYSDAVLLHPNLLAMA
mmetsp:Transcript_43549/g.111348  ORF Transcript_43549/g.111348 Transcript_43549/m.111348 type:complete len:283 (-) Transcript_43549:119-967(-)